MAILTRRPGSSTVGRSSTLSPIPIFTQDEQLVANLGSELRGPEDRWVVATEVGFIDFPTKTWGIGADTPDAARCSFSAAATSPSSVTPFSGDRACSAPEERVHLRRDCGIHMNIGEAF